MKTLESEFRTDFLFLHYVMILINLSSTYVLFQRWWWKKNLIIIIIIIITIEMIFFFILFVLTHLLAFVHLLSTKDRRMCLFFACHLSSLTSTRVHITTCLFSIPSISIDWKSTMNRCLLEKLFFFLLNNCWLNFNCSYACVCVQWDIYIYTLIRRGREKRGSMCIRLFLALTFRLLDWTITVNRVSRWKESSGFILFFFFFFFDY